jgi:hypothetical protein
LRELSADDQVTTAMLSRKNRVLNCPHFSLRAGAPEGEQPTPEAEELHRRFMRDLERTNLRTVISGMLDAPYYGFTPLELVWRNDGDWWHIVDIVARPYHWFRFDSRNNPVFVGELGRSAGPAPIASGKFVFVTITPPRQSLRLDSSPLSVAGELHTRGVSFIARFVEAARDALGCGESAVPASKKTRERTRAAFRAWCRTPCRCALGAKSS